MQVNHAVQQHILYQKDDSARNDPPPPSLSESRAQARGARGRSVRGNTPSSSSGARGPVIAQVSARAGNPRPRRASADSSAAPDLGPTRTSTIYGADAVSPPNPKDSLPHREQQVGEYADRVKAQIANVESGSEAERNVKFLNARPFTTPSGYFSGALLAAGLDPDEQIKATFDSYTGQGRPQSQTGSDERTYSAWQIAAGALAHDRPAQGGTVNFQSLHLAPADEVKVKALESLGTTLQARWARDVGNPMQDASGPVAERSGEADVYSARATLQSLQSDKTAFGQLSAEGRQAIDRTLGEAGQVIVPNLYGYPLAGHAFIPYTPYDGNYEHRPNQGLMVDLTGGTVSEINGDQDFANWAKRHHDNLLQSFNARDEQGGLDAHWPKASDVLDDLIAGKKVTYPGYRNFVSDMPVPVSELFNYTKARGGDYQLKYGKLTAGAGTGGGGDVASQYRAVNAKNARWADQTQVFGATEQNWKSAKEFWGNTFSYVPVVGTLGTIVFGAHDGLNGMTAQDRIGGNVAAAISSLQLVHDLAPGAAESMSAHSPSVSGSSDAAQRSSWKYDSANSEFAFNPPRTLKDGRTGYPMGPTRPPKLPRTESPQPGPSGTPPQPSSPALGSSGSQPQWPPRSTDSGESQWTPQSPSSDATGSKSPSSGSYYGDISSSPSETPVTIEPLQSLRPVTDPLRVSKQAAGNLLMDEMEQLAGKNNVKRYVGLNALTTDRDLPDGGMERIRKSFEEAAIDMENVMRRLEDPRQKAAVAAYARNALHITKPEVVDAVRERLYDSARRMHNVIDGHLRDGLSRIEFFERLSKQSPQSRMNGLEAVLGICNVYDPEERICINLDRLRERFSRTPPHDMIASSERTLTETIEHESSHLAVGSYDYSYAESTDNLDQLCNAKGAYDQFSKNLSEWERGDGRHGLENPSSLTRRVLGISGPVSGAYRHAVANAFRTDEMQRADILLSNADNLTIMLRDIGQDRRYDAYTN